MKIDFKFQISNFKLDLTSCVLVLLSLCVYFLTRLYHLTIIPVFCDEAIYIRWAQVMRAEPSLRFLPLSVGSPPFFMWMIMPFLKMFADPLFAGRLLSVFCGFGSLIGLFFASFLIFNNKRLSLFSIMFYAIVPYYVFSERLALIDSMLSLQGIWLIVFALLLVKKPKLDLLIIAGVIFGVSLMTKSFAVFFLIPLFSIFWLKKWNLKDKKTTFIDFVKAILGLILILIIGFGIYNFILRLGPNFSLITSRNDMGIYSFQEIIKHPLDPLVPHLKDLLDWFPNLISPIIFSFSLLGFIIGIKKKRPETFFLILCSFGPIFIESFISKVLTPRYLLFAIWPFIVMAAYSLETLFTQFETKPPKLVFKIILPLFLILFAAIPAIKYDFLLLTQPEKSPLPRNLRSGHLEIWTSGYGIKEAAGYIKEIAKTQKVLVGTEGYFGTLPDGLQMYLEGASNITIIGVGQPITEISPKLLDGLKDNRVFLLVNDSRLEISDTDKLKLIAKYSKAVDLQGTQENLLLLEVTN